MKHRHTTFHAQARPVRICQKARRTRYAELEFLHPVGYADLVVHSGAFGV
jgi:hypothetical protein